jgi:hypothetical protein
MNIHPSTRVLLAGTELLAQHDAAQALPQQQGDLQGEVDFPAFVGGLVNGVFDAAVDASVKQMDAYGQLVGSVEKPAEKPEPDLRTLVAPALTPRR